MRNRRTLVLLCVLVLVFSLCSPAMAAEEKEIVELGDGFYAVITLEQTHITRAGDTVQGRKVGTLYHTGEKIGTATLLAQFDTSGSTAKATYALITGDGINGWDYSYGTESCSGNKATGTAYFTDGNVIRSLTLTLTCSPSGVIS